MTKDEALKLIDDHKNALLDPCAMLGWTWLRVIISGMTDEEWEIAVGRAAEVLSR